MVTEVFKYLFFGVLATLVYMVSRILIFQLTNQGTLSAVLASAIAIIFAFFTNDRLVFKQVRQNSLIRKRQVWLRALLSSWVLAY